MYIYIYLYNYVSIYVYIYKRSQKKLKSTNHKFPTAKSAAKSSTFPSDSPVRGMGETTATAALTLAWRSIASV